MLCEECERKIKKVRCFQCEKEIYLFGPYCYECGGKLEEEEFSVEERILCLDEMCVGTINEEGVCNVCGKPYNLG